MTATRRSLFRKGLLGGLLLAFGGSAGIALRRTRLGPQARPAQRDPRRAPHDEHEPAQEALFE